MRKANSIISMIMTFFIIFTTIIPVFAMESQPETVHIGSAQDLVQLSQDCSIDSWSQGRTVLLDADIDLKDIDFLPIPIFGGIFDGQGYTIRELSVTVEGSNQGLFRYLQEDATIKNLSVEGVVTPLGEKSNIGGIVGNNEGLLEDCSFSGFVKGKDTVGGIVGWNNSSGMVINSYFNGVIYGESKVGGIVGYNAGTVLRCSNYSNVNTTVEDEQLEFSEITLDNINLSKLITDGIDIGGIAGVNTGIVQNSENYGKVGYPHVGYNVGGIAGRQSGYITKCSNYGSIYGRKEVAGIVGQIEPHISTIIESSKLRQLQKELNALDSSITNMINDTKGFSDTVTQNLSSIQDDIDNSKTHAQSLIDQTELMINMDIEELNKINVIGIEALDKLIPITEILADTIETMGEAIYPMEKALEYISRLMEESAYLTEKLKGVLDSIEDSINKMNNAQEKLKKAHADILKARELLRKGETDGVLELLQSAFDNINDVRKSLKKAIINLDLKAVFDEILDEAKDMVESLDDTSKFMTYALDYMLEAIVLIEDAIDDSADIFEGLDDLMKFFTEQEELEFATTDDLYEKTKEDLYGSINDVSTSLSGFIKDINTEGNKLMEGMQSVSDQLFRLMNLMINIIEEISSGDVVEEDIVKDVSREDIENKIEGKVSDCINLGTIEGDLNVGGIAGAMSIELKLDPEVDLNIKDKFSFNTVFETRAIISGCENKGSIIAKKNGVGGIVGNMDLGYIKDCIVLSSVESTDGNYVGGISGKSDAPIVSSYARCALSGGNYVGGISGLGTEITDSYTLVEVNRSKACVGAIAGNIDKNSNIERNYFVSDILRGIDGISYVGRAEPITYQNLISIENLPNIFKDFKLNFWVDDQIIDTVNFDYGDSISQKDFPEFPAKEGNYGRWEEIDTVNLTFDADIHAVYISYLSILESKEKRDDILPIVLVEGSFIEVDYLTLIPNEGKGPKLEKDATQLEQWSVVIPQDGKSMHTIRYLPPEYSGNLEVYILTDEKWIKTKGQWDGKYFVFETHGNNITFSIVDDGFSYIKYIVLVCMVILIIIISTIFIKRTRKRESKSDSVIK